MSTISRGLSPVPFTQVTLRDAFWAPRQETNRRATIPYFYEWCEQTGRTGVWDMTWKPGDPDTPHIFWDSDVAKWMEAASYSLATHYDAQLDALLDTLIAKMTRAQLPDGYLNTHYILVEPEKRWTNLRVCHELYSAGHLIEAAVAHYQATGKQTLLNVLRRYADHIDATFGREPGKKRGYCGHEEIELALVKLYRATGEARYLRLAQYFVDERGRQPHYYDIEAHARGQEPTTSYEIFQAHIPVRQQTEVVGHAVRAMYLYSGMADVARATGDTELQQVGTRLWQHLTTKRMYLTGGIGPSAHNEGFTTDYDLPDETAYAETCAAIGLVFWAHRMLQWTAEAQYADVMERALYNGTISGVSLDGRHFFYENPLASRGKHHRQEGFGCACCPPNIARMLASVSGYFYSVNESDAWVHLYAQGEGRLQIQGREVAIQQTAAYPWDGVVKIQVSPPAPMTFALHLRVPGWCDNWQLSINDMPATGEMDKGYLRLARAWHPGDEVTLRLAMPVRQVYANPQVRQMLGRVALQRGPIVYCVEGVDNGDLPLDRLAISAGAAWQTEHRPDLLGGVTVLRGEATVVDDNGWENDLYRFAAPQIQPRRVMAVPYCVWDNRAPGEMRVWFRER